MHQIVLEKFNLNALKRYGIKEENIYFYEDKFPSWEKIKQYIQNINEKANENDSLLFILTSHGKENSDSIAFNDDYLKMKNIYNYFYINLPINMKMINLDQWFSGSRISYLQKSNFDTNITVFSTTDRENSSYQFIENLFFNSGVGKNFDTNEAFFKDDIEYISNLPKYTSIHSELWLEEVFKETDIDKNKNISMNEMIDSFSKEKKFFLEEMIFNPFGKDVYIGDIYWYKE